MHAQDTTDDGYFDAPEQVIEDPEIDMLIFRLQHAGRAHDFALNIDLVLLQVERLALGGAAQVLDDEDFSKIMQALGTAAEAGYAAPPVGVSRDQAMQGMLLLAYAIAFWHLPDDQRAANRSLRTVLREGLRVYRNALHSSCLLGHITEMVQARSAPLHPKRIADLCSDAGIVGFPTDVLRGFAEAFAVAA